MNQGPVGPMGLETVGFEFYNPNMGPPGPMGLMGPRGSAGKDAKLSAGLLKDLVYFRRNHMKTLLSQTKFLPTDLEDIILAYLPCDDANYKNP